MRKTTQKILLLLYKTDQETDRSVPIHFLRECLPELSDSGFRALLHYMRRQQLLSVVGKGMSKCVIGTNTGHRSLEAEFSWLEKLPPSDPDNQDLERGYLLICKTVQHSRNHIYDLRQLMKRSGAITIERNVYFWPGELPRGLKVELSSRFRTSVLVIQTREWLFGHWELDNTERVDFVDMDGVSSGISTQLIGLITTVKPSSTMNHQQKMQFFSLLNQIVDTFAETRGTVVANTKYREQFFNILCLLHQIPIA